MTTSTANTTKPKPFPKKRARKPPNNNPGKRTNYDELIRYLSQANGSTIAEMQETIKMQAHSIRGSLSTLKKKHGFEIEYDRESKRYRKV